MTASGGAGILFSFATNAAYLYHIHLLTCWGGGTTNATVPTTRKAATLATTNSELMRAIVLWFKLLSARM